MYMDLLIRQLNDWRYRDVGRWRLRVWPEWNHRRDGRYQMVALLSRFVAVGRTVAVVVSDALLFP
jgi:hypothetical protein